MAKVVIFLLTLSVSASYWGGAKAQYSSNDDCSSVIVSLSPCLGYVTGKETAPTLPCCSSLETVVEIKPRCLCEVVNGTAASSLGITIDPTRALQLPDACNVKTPPVSRCNGAPSSSPSSAPKHSAESGSSSNSTAARPATKSPAASDAKKLMQTQLSSSLLIIIMFFFVASFIFI